MTRQIITFLPYCYLNCLLLFLLPSCLLSCLSVEQLNEEMDSFTLWTGFPAYHNHYQVKKKKKNHHKHTLTHTKVNELRTKHSCNLDLKDSYQHFQNKLLPLQMSQHISVPTLVMKRSVGSQCMWQINIHSYTWTFDFVLVVSNQDFSTVALCNDTLLYLVHDKKVHQFGRHRTSSHFWRSELCMCIKWP